MAIVSALTHFNAAALFSDIPLKIAGLGMSIGFSSVVEKECITRCPSLISKKVDLDSEQ